MKPRKAVHWLWSIKLLTFLALTLSPLAAGAPASAQYVAPGRPVYPARHGPSKDDFQSKLKESPWTVGTFRLSPWLGLRDVSIVTDLNQQGEDLGDDFTLTVGAGLRGYLPAGTKVIFAAHALPEYVWWQDNEDKKGLAGRYGLGVFGYFNRLSLELSQRRLEQQGYFSSEIQALTTSRNDVSTFSFGLEVARNLSLFGIASDTEYHNEEGGATFSALDRTTESGLIGVRYSNPRGWALELGYSDSSNDFADGARDLSNTGTAELASIIFDRSKIGFRLDLSFEQREADEGSAFGSFNDTTGSFNVLWQPSDKTAILGYVRRDQTYSVDDRFTLLLQERQGARFNYAFGRGSLGLFGEVGEDEFEAASPGLPDRIDDVTAYGADLRIELREVSLSVRAVFTDYDSGFAEFDRDSTRLQFSVGFEAIRKFTSGLVEKLSLGSPGTDW